MKRFVSFLAAAILATTLFTVSAFAHGHCGGGRARISYGYCTVEDCSIAYNHLHGNTWCYGHYIGDGHDYHALCDVSGCTLTTIHEHDGESFFPNAQGDTGYYSSGYWGGGRCHY